jgi:hypothetical protein
MGENRKSSRRRYESQFSQARDVAFGEPFKSRARLEAENTALRPATHCPVAQNPLASSTQKYRPIAVGVAVPTVPSDCECDHHRQTCDGDPLASARLSDLLAMEVSLERRPSED